MLWEGDELTQTAQETFASRTSATTSRQHSLLIWFALQEQNCSKTGMRVRIMLVISELGIMANCDIPCHTPYPFNCDTPRHTGPLANCGNPVTLVTPKL